MKSATELKAKVEPKPYVEAKHSMLKSRQSPSRERAELAAIHVVEEDDQHVRHTLGRLDLETPC